MKSFSLEVSLRRIWACLFCNSLGRGWGGCWWEIRWPLKDSPLCGTIVTWSPEWGERAGVVETSVFPPQDPVGGLGFLAGHLASTLLHGWFGKQIAENSKESWNLENRFYVRAFLMHSQGWIWITWACRGPYRFLVSAMWGRISLSCMKPWWEVGPRSFKQLWLSGSTSGSWLSTWK